MLRLGLSPAFEDKTPWKICNVTVYFRVTKVSKSDKGCRERHGYCQTIQNPQKIYVIFPAVLVSEPPHAQEQHQRTSMTGKSSVPHSEDFQKTFPRTEIIVRLIENAMPETGSDQSSDQQSVEKWIKKSLVDFLPFEELREQPVTKNEPGNKQETIPPYGERSNPEYLRIHVPMYEQRIHNQLSLFVQR